MTSKNLNFILALSCRLGGDLFKRIPSYLKSVQMNEQEIPVTKTAKEVMRHFVPETIVDILLNDLNLISEKAFALVKSHKEWKSKLTEK